MHHSRPIRRLAKSHITTNCLRERCLLCELGFVVRMLEDAHGTNCHSSNFCKTVGVLAQGGVLQHDPKQKSDCMSRLPASNALELIDYGHEVDYAPMIQSFHRFLVDHFSSEGNTFPHNPLLLRSLAQRTHPNSPAAAPTTQLLGIDAKTIITCLSCKAIREKESMTHIVDLVYPRKVCTFFSLTFTN
jgi:PAB-dependent poly(A)-specific ribonuclease subunit 2